MSAVPGWWLLPIAALLGGACAAFSRTYVAHIHEGRPLNAATFWSVVRRAFELKGRKEKQKSDTTDRDAEARGLIKPAFLFSGFLFIAAVPFAILPSWANLAVVVAVAWLAILGLIDARTGYLPDALTMPLLWLGLALAWFNLRGETCTTLWPQRCWVTCFSSLLI